MYCIRDINRILRLFVVFAGESSFCDGKECAFFREEKRVAFLGGFGYNKEYEKERARKQCCFVRGAEGAESSSSPA